MEGSREMGEFLGVLHRLNKEFFTNRRLGNWLAALGMIGLLETAGCSSKEQKLYEEFPPSNTPSTPSEVNDKDGDGYSEAGGDCDDADASSHPLAEEAFVADGIDQNCDGCDLNATGDDAEVHKMGDGTCMTIGEAAKLCDGDQDDSYNSGECEESPTDEIASTQWIFTVGYLPTPVHSAEEARAACESRGLRVPSFSQLQKACGGPESNSYPYGNTYDSSGCNTWDAGVHAYVSTGSFQNCVSPWQNEGGIFDLNGNYPEYGEDRDASGNISSTFTYGGSWNASAPDCSTQNLEGWSNAAVRCVE